MSKVRIAGAVMLADILFFFEANPSIVFFLMHLGHFFDILLQEDLINSTLIVCLMVESYMVSQ